MRLFVFGLAVLTLVALIPSGDSHAQPAPKSFDVILLIDKSTSIRSTDPGDDRLAAMSLFVSLLDQGRVGIVSFGNEGLVELPLTAITDEGQRSQVIDALTTKLANDTIVDNQATDMLDGLAKSYEQLAQNRSNQSSGQVIILLTDGAPCRHGGFTGPDDVNNYKTQIQQKVQEGKQNGVFLFTFGFLPTGFQPPSSDPCDNPDRSLMSALNATGLSGLDASNQEIVSAFTGRPYLQTDQQDSRPVPQQIVDRYVKVWQALYGIAANARPVANGDTIIVPPGTLALFAIVPFLGVVTPEFALKGSNGQRDDLRTSVIGQNLVVRKDSPSAGVRTVQLGTGSGDALLFFQLQFTVSVLDEVNGQAFSSIQSLPDQADFGLLVQPQAPGLEDLPQQLLDSGLLSLNVRPYEPGSACRIEQADKASLRTNAQKKGEFVATRRVPTDVPSGVIEVVGGIAGLSICDRKLLTLPQRESPSPSPIEPPARAEGGSGTSWPLIVATIALILILALAVVGLLRWRGHRPDPLDGELQGQGLPGGRLYLNTLNKREATVGGEGSDIALAGLAGVAAVLYRERGELEDVTMIRPVGDSYETRVSVGNTGLAAPTTIPISGPTALPRNAVVVFLQGDQEIVRFTFRQT